MDIIFREMISSGKPYPQNYRSGGFRTLDDVEGEKQVSSDRLRSIVVCDRIIVSSVALVTCFYLIVS
ncbi:MAG: hypothetical protein K1W30_10995 [Lachnospiraceae bacterium]